MLWGYYNQVNNIYPMIQNTGIGSGDKVHLECNPLSSISINIHIPELQSRGATVVYTSPSEDTTAPICTVNLYQPGTTNPITRVYAGQGFDIYMGGSSDGDCGSGIQMVRFCCDNLQDGIPQGTWTEWYDWYSSSGDWNASTRVKGWSFPSVGNMEGWAEVRDGNGNAALDNRNIQVRQQVVVGVEVHPANKLMVAAPWVVAIVLLLGGGALIMRRFKVF